VAGNIKRRIAIDGTQASDSINNSNINQYFARIKHTAKIKGKFALSKQLLISIRKTAVRFSPSSTSETPSPHREI